MVAIRQGTRVRRGSEGRVRLAVLMAKISADNGGHQAPKGGVHVDIYVTPPDGFRLELFSNAVSGTALQIRLASILHSGREATVRSGRSKCPVSPMSCSQRSQDLQWTCTPDQAHHINNLSPSFTVVGNGQTSCRRKGLNSQSSNTSSAVAPPRSESR